MVIASELADAVESTGDLLIRFLEGFNDTNAAAQAPNLPNHAAWTLGHLALTMHRAAERIAGETFPLQWDPEPYAFGSTPTADRDDYPPLAEMVQRYRRSLKLAAGAARKTGEAGLKKEVAWGRTTTTTRDLLLRMVWHNGVHCGQLIDLRRALGLGTVIG